MPARPIFFLSSVKIGGLATKICAGKAENKNAGHKPALPFFFWWLWHRPYISEKTERRHFEISHFARKLFAQNVSTFQFCPVLFFFKIFPEVFLFFTKKQTTPLWRLVQDVILIFPGLAPIFQRIFNEHYALR